MIDDEHFHQYSLKHKVAWVHVPKVASTSVQSALRESGFSDLKTTTLKHIHSLRRDPEMVIFSIWRDPVDRLVSAYTNLALDTHSKRIEHEGLGHEPSWEKFLAHVLSQPISEELDIHWRPQNYYNFYNGDLVPTCVLRFSHLQEEWEGLREKTDLAPLPHSRKTKNVKPEVTDQQRVDIVRYYGMDYTYKGWHFGGNGALDSVSDG